MAERSIYMTVVLKIDEPQGQTLVEFLKTLPYVTLIAEEPTAYDTGWEKETTRNFLAGYADSDSIYDEL